MPISYPEILSLKAEGVPLEWRDQDAMLYALGVGMGADPLDADELPFVYENGLKAVPTLATVVAFGAGPLGRSGINFMMVVHGDQEVVFHRPFPAEGKVVADTTIPAVYDKGPKGAIIIQRTELNDEGGEPVATLTASVMARGDGGFGGPEGGAPEPHQVPARKPDLTIDISTRPDQALLYRLCGDRNPLHADPAFAQIVGFPRPILHGLCTYGISCRAVLQACAGYDPARIRSHYARFSAPIFPGETLTMDLWQDGDVVSFEGRVAERGVKALKNGKAVVGA
jgi:acyl dehydratase